VIAYNFDVQGYGMTEAGPLAISMAFAKVPSKIKPGACGTVVRNAEMKIVDTETGDSLPRNKHGEICIRGTKVMKGIPSYSYTCLLHTFIIPYITLCVTLTNILNITEQYGWRLIAMFSLNMIDLEFLIWPILFLI